MPPPSAAEEDSPATPSTADRYRFGVFEFEARTGELRKAGARVKLRLQPARALTLLLARRGEVVGRDELRAHLWPDDTTVDFDQGLNSCIKDVRAALGDDADAPRYVETLPRVGYRWVGPADLGLPAPAAPVAPAPALPAPRPRWQPVAAAGLLGAALALALAWTLAAPPPPAPAPPTWSRLTYRRGVVEAARFGPGGEIVYSADFEGEGRQLHAANAGVPEARRLGFEGASLVGINARGEVHLLGERSARRGRALVRGPLSGEGSKVLAEGVLLADLVPPGNDVAVVRVPPEGQVGLRLEFPLGKEIARLNSPSALRVSRDGKKVAVVEHPVAGQRACRVLVLDRDGRVEPTDGEWAAVDGLAWSPDGALWLTGARPGAGPALHAVGRDGVARPRLTVGGWLVLHDLSEDGRALVERVALRGELRFGREGAPERDLAWLDGSSPVALSDDGGVVLFSEEGEGGGAGQATYLRPTDGGPAVRLGSGRATGLSGDGRTAYVVGAGELPEAFELVPVGAGSARRVTLPGLAWLQAVFPLRDGRLLVVGGERDHHGRVWLAREGGERPLPVTPEHFVTARDTASPDGSAVVAGCAPQRHCLYRTRDGSVVQLPGLGDAVPLRFDASGRYLFVRTRAPLPAVIERLELATGARTPWRTLAPEDRVGVEALGRVVLTPDGRAWAYRLERRLSELYLVEGLTVP